MTKTMARVAAGTGAFGSAICRRLATPEEFPGLIASLTSCEAGYITGTHIAISGVWNET